MTDSTPHGRFARVSEKKRAGATYTPTVLADLLADRLLSADADLAELTLLDPACGDGVLLQAAMAVRRSQGRHHDHWVGLDADEAAVHHTRRRLGLVTPRLTLRHLDFLSEGDEVEPVDRIIANPPWVRTQVLGAELARSLATRFGLQGRIDLSQVFVLAMLDRLRPGGRAAVLVPNKLLQTRGAARFRALLQERAALVEVVDLGDTRLFDAAVLPAMLVFEKREEPARACRFWSVYTVGEPLAEPSVPVADFSQLWDQAGVYALPDGRRFEVQVGELVEQGPHRTWQRGGPSVQAWLDRIEAHTALRLGDLGMVRVGVKSTADPVFVAPDWAAMAEAERPELLRALTTHHRARPFRPLLAGPSSQILYPHEVVDGQRRPVDLGRYPRARAFLEKHRKRLEGRKYVREAGRAWYELWVPHDPSAWAAPKLVFRDIAPRSTCWLDLEGTVVNGDCYWLATHDHVSDDLLYLALAVANSSLADAWYDRMCNNRLYAGRRRYLSQFLSEYPLPNPLLASSQALASHARRLVDRLATEPLDACADDIARLDAEVWAAFGLDSSAPPP